MCGIVGWYSPSEKTIDPSLLNRMNDSQTHRGPDESGTFIQPGIGLGHRRLSIIDLSSGQQPLFNEDKSVVVVYNGEIYNYQSLAEELKQLGHSFRTHCDTEVIVHAWEQWGEACVKRFRGMFAFALWDSKKKTLFLARDRLGIKPLYYSQLDDGDIIFSSELKALQLHPKLSRELDPCAVEEYFAFGYVPEPRTILKGVHKLEPGYTLRIARDHSQLKLHQYWDVPFKPHAAADEKQLEEELLERLREAVSIRLVSEVPLGAFLSGGVDSSAVVALMAGLEPDKAVHTCSIGFGDPRYNETSYAEQVAQRYHTDHYTETVEADDFDLLDRLAEMYDEPYADSSAIPTYRVCELARKRVTVALSGDGGDENFAGYRRHRWHMNEELIRGPMPALLRRPLFKMLGTCYPKMDWAPRIFRAKSTFQALALDSLSAYLHSVSTMNDDLRRSLFSADFTRQLQGYQAIEVFKRHAANAPSDHPLSLIQYLDMKTYLPGDILTKVDRASMAHSLEVRVPILDHEFVEWVSGLPPSLKLRKREGKYIFKRALSNLLPEDILYRPKMGFAVPLASWFRGPLKQRVKDTILGSALHDCGIFNSHHLETIVSQHQSGVRDHSREIWTLFMFDAFYRKVA